VEKRPKTNLDKPRESRHAPRQRDPDEFWSGLGLDVDSMSPRAQVITSLAVLVPVAVGAVLVLAVFQWIWWLIFVFGWLLFPAFGLLLKGIAGLAEGGNAERLPGSNGERELLVALEEHGELTPTRAAMETSLSVAEADRMLKELTEAGHLEVRVRGGGLFYALWGAEDKGALRGAEGRL